MVAAFLRDRKLTIKIDNCIATPIPIVRGSLQGSVLGCLLCCVTTQLLTVGLRDNRMAIPRYFPQDSSDEEDVVFWQDVQAQRLLPATFLYVDETTLVDVVPLASASRHLTTASTRETLNDIELGKDFEELSTRAGDIKMKINQKKTQLLVISPPNGCDTEASFTVNGVTTSSIDCLKLVGFTFGNKPGAGAHVEAIADKYMRKKWMLYHLRDAGFKGRQLFRLYCCYIRSIIEYCSVAYHALLNKGQEEHLKRLQRHAVRMCFGHGRPVEEIMAEECIESLHDRRVRRADAFIRKSAANPRFGPKWFPARQDVPWGLRRRRQVQEVRARTRRRFMSPLAFLKRRANDMGIAAPAS